MAEEDTNNKSQGLPRERAKQSLMGDLESIKSLLVKDNDDSLEDMEWAKRVQSRLAKMAAQVGSNTSDSNSSTDSDSGDDDDDVPLFLDENSADASQGVRQGAPSRENPKQQPAKANDDTPILRGVELDQSDHRSNSIPEPPTLTMAFRENPFLPKGVLDKLKNNEDGSNRSVSSLSARGGYTNKAQQEQDALQQVFHRWHDQLEQNTELVLQEVLDDYVPRIEAEMRRRLKVRLDDMIKELIDNQLKHRKDDY